MVLSLLVTILSLTTSMADTPSLKKLFVEMPDSLLPYLSHNNRLDFIDFMASDMKSEVTNDFGGKSVMTALADDSLTIVLNESSRVDLLILELAHPSDSAQHVIAMIRTYSIDGRLAETDLEFYSIGWQRLSDPPQLTVPHRKRLKEYVKPSNIINFYREKINKT